MKLLAIDPGTRRTGLAVFAGEKLLSWHIARGGRQDPPERRIISLLEQLDEVAAMHPEITAVACEGTTAIDGAQPAAALQMFILRLRRWARETFGPSTTWALYNPTTVKNAIRPRGVSAKARKSMGTKAVTALGVRMVYGDEAGAIEGELIDDVVDAIAVGHCHIVKTAEREVLERADST